MLRSSLGERALRLWLREGYEVHALGVHGGRCRWRWRWGDQDTGFDSQLFTLVHKPLRNVPWPPPFFVYSTTVRTTDGHIFNINSILTSFRLGLEKLLWIPSSSRPFFFSLFFFSFFFPCHHQQNARSTNNSMHTVLHSKFPYSVRTSLQVFPDPSFFLSSINEIRGEIVDVAGRRKDGVRI